MFPVRNHGTTFAAHVEHNAAVYLPLTSCTGSSANSKSAGPPPQQPRPAVRETDSALNKVSVAAQTIT